jgi:flagellar protein FliS
LPYTNTLPAANRYRETSIKTASPGKQIVMLYDAAVKQLDRGIDLIQQNSSGKKDPAKIEQIGKAIIKAQEIISELEVSLDFEQGGEIARNLFSLYAWFSQELLTANISQDLRRILSVRNMMNELRAAWAEIAAKNGPENPGRAAVGLNIAG